MRKIAEAIKSQLTWHQPSALKMEYELRAGDEPVAALRFRSAFGSFATAKGADGSWTFKRIGFIRTRVSIRIYGSDLDLATFQNNTWSGGGTLEFADGRKYPATTNFWQTQYEFRTEVGEPLIRFYTRGLIHLSADVEIFPNASALPELPWMVMLGWYLAVMLHTDTCAIAGVGGAAAAAG